MSKEKFNEFCNNKSNIKVLLLTTLVLNVIFFTSFLNTNSKYIKETQFDNALKYSNKFIELSKTWDSKNITARSGGTYDVIPISAKFSRNDVVRTGETDVYTIDVPSGCTIENINESNASIKGTWNKKDNTITYKDLGTADITLSISCDVNSVIREDRIYIPITIKEKVEKEESFDYLSGNFNILLSEYRKDKYTATNTFTIEKNVDSIYEKLKDLLKNSYFPTYIDQVYSLRVADLIKKAIINDSNPSSEYIRPYFGLTKDNFEASLTEKNGKKYINGVPGLKVTVNTDSYVFEVEDSFIGYAMTYTQKNNNLYFSFKEKNDSVLADLENMFNEYLTIYYSSTEIELINEYLQDKNLARYVLYNEGSIFGITQRLEESNLVWINIKNLLRAAQPSSNSPIEVDSSSTPNDRGMQAFNDFKSICPDADNCSIKGLKQESIDNIKAILGAEVDNDKVYDFIDQFTSHSGPINEYYIVPSTYMDGENPKIQYVMLHIQSTGEKEEDNLIHTYLDIKPTDESELLSLEFNEASPKDVKITILASASEADIDDIVFYIQELQKMFGNEPESEETLKTQIREAMSSDKTLTFSLPFIVEVINLT